MQQSSAEATALPFQWNLLAWAALVGTATGLAVVGFHELLGFINNFLFGPFVEGLLSLGTSTAPPAPELPSLPPEGSTPLKALLEIGLGGLGFLPPPPAPPLPAPPALPSAPGWLDLWPVVVVPTVGGLAVGVLRRIGGDLGPGLPSLQAMAEGSQPATPKLPLLRLVAASLSLGSGASLGPEGPSVEGGGNIGLWVGERGRLTPQSQKTLVAAGVAAGLAAGFKAPIAGVFFALEGSFSAIPGRPSVRAVLVAAVASCLVTQLCLGDTPILRLPAYEVRSPLELPLYLGLGVASSLMSWLLISLLAAGRSQRLQQWLGRLPIGLPTALGGAAVGGMALLFPQVLGVGYDTIEALLGRDGGIPLLTLAVLLVVKVLATAVSSATGFVGGGFAPSLFLGAVLGNCYGQILGDSGLHLPVAEPPAYAMVGMAAVLAGSARAPLTALLLLFELTRDIRIVLPLMAAAGLSAALVERWQGLHDPGLLGPDPMEEERRGRLTALSVAEAFEPEAPLVLEADTPVLQALNQLVACHGHALIVSEGEWAMGLVTLPDLQRVLSAKQHWTTQQIAQEGPSHRLDKQTNRPADDCAMDSEPRLLDCRRGELVWLPLCASLAQLEEQLLSQGLRQLPVFDLPQSREGALPHGLPARGLPLSRLRGLASRDGMALALARQISWPDRRPGDPTDPPPDPPGTDG
ncbi:chloride channel protein [Synechococcus sp. CBW1107]|uniref:chloride channel protein n=1 Tax=Synechococcus sp. CBW1107 TaxID=2789857 RepID=UPI002AD335E7|nr:chloride channel protein [Synechococcus sp. CBW1107]CAK6691820.1 Voltage-gated ClC-type chloride channel ClcB [Synechococcus sp. CBW1107]